jgi:hypothetical protein
MIYEIKGYEVPLFTIRYVMSIFGITKSGVLQKEGRGNLPTSNFKSSTGSRLYSIEDLSLIDYIYKEVWPYKQGVKVPDWTKELIREAFIQSKKVVLESGRSISSDDWLYLDSKYTQFSRHRLQIYIESWRRRLLDCNAFFPELVDEE